MTNLIIIVVVIVAIAIAINLFFDKDKSLLKSSNEREKKEYKYKKKPFFMTQSESTFYNSLNLAVENKYYIFPQVHLSSIIDNKVKGQNWKAAFKHINQKSVDFVLCDKKYISPKLAIELDDRTHEGEDRIKRDIEVERILKEAKLPLLRIKSSISSDYGNLREQIETILNNKN